MTWETPFGRRLLLSVDAAGYGGRDDQRQRALQTGLIQVLDRAAGRAGLDRSAWTKQAAGDGELAILPPGESDREPIVVERFVRELDGALAEHNRDLRDVARMRLRLALHYGVVAPGDNGFVGQGVVAVSRLVDCAQIKAALKQLSDAHLAVILSGQVFRDSVAERNTPTLPPEKFREVSVRVKEYHQSAHLYLPGHDVRSITLPESDSEPRRVSVTLPSSGERLEQDGRLAESAPDTVNACSATESTGDRAVATTTVNGSVTMSGGTIGMVWNR